MKHGTVTTPIMQFTPSYTGNNTTTSAATMYCSVCRGPIWPGECGVTMGDRIAHLKCCKVG